jgi:hypothetical protein
MPVMMDIARKNNARFNIQRYLYSTMVTVMYIIIWDVQ